MPTHSKTDAMPELGAATTNWLDVAWEIQSLRLPTLEQLENEQAGRLGPPGDGGGGRMLKASGLRFPSVPQAESHDEATLEVRDPNFVPSSRNVYRVVIVYADHFASIKQIADWIYKNQGLLLDHSTRTLPLFDVVGSRELDRAEVAMLSQCDASYRREGLRAVNMSPEGT